MRKSKPVVLVFLALACLTSCSRKSQTSPNAGLPRVDHVFIVVLQDHAFDTVVGNPAMPYFNQLASQNVLLTNYTTESGMSLDNSLYLVTGEGTSSVPYLGKRLYFRDNLVRRLRAAGLTWKSYAEGLPRRGFTKDEGFNAPYVKRHNPFPYLADVWLRPSERENIVPFTQFAKDLAANSLPNYSWIVPTGPHNAHMEDCPDGKSQCTDTDRLAECDRWLQRNIPQLLSNDTFRQSGLLIIAFDDIEGNRSGRVPVVLVSSFAKHSYRSPTPANHAATLRLMLAALGISDFPGDAESAPDLSDCFDFRSASTH